MPKYNFRLYKFVLHVKRTKLDGLKLSFSMWDIFRWSEVVLSACWTNLDALILLDRGGDQNAGLGINAASQQTLLLSPAPHPIQC